MEYAGRGRAGKRGAGGIAGVATGLKVGVGTSLLKGVTSLILGLAIGLMGIDELTGQPRLAFGMMSLLDGIDIVIVARRAALDMPFDALTNDLSAALKDEDLDALKPRLHDALAGTENMKSSVDSLQEQLSVSLREIETLRAVFTEVDGVTFFFEGSLDERAHFGFIFNDKHAHRSFCPQVGGL